MNNILLYTILCLVSVASLTASTYLFRPENSIKMDSTKHIILMILVFLGIFFAILAGKLCLTV
jgi:hypothetical protein